MSKLGELLRSARESNGLTVKDVAEKTKIRNFYIEQLEEDSLEGLPQPIFVKGFIRNLARLYEIDTDEVLAQYSELVNPPKEESLNIPDEKEVSRPEPSVKERREPAKKPVVPKRTTKHRSVKMVQQNKPRRALAAIVLLLVLAVAVYVGATLMGDGGETAGELIPIEPINEVPIPEVPEVVDEIEPQAVEEPSTNVYQEFEYEYISPEYIEDGLDIMVKVSEVTGSKCWVSANIDGESEYAGTLESGEVVRFFGNNSIQLTLGDAGAVSIYKDGIDTGFEGKQGQVVYKDYLEE
ncbi:helix-turn-helix domain-containing protein [Clostridia bacterium]|nr:helix-turn-helix domain-containing protein [Clostridia bacterium]